LFTPGTICSASLRYSRRSIARRRPKADARGMPDPVIERDEVVALLFNVSDIVFQLTRIRQLLEEDDGEEEAD
jgi:hypothetical protein